MTTKKQVEDALAGIILPGIERSLPEMNLVNAISVKSGNVKLKLADAAVNPQLQEATSNLVKEQLQKLDGVKKVTVEYVESKPADLNQVGHVIAIMSGKGGVGKSLVTGLSAVALRRKGYRVGILDADLTGPSIPKMFGLSQKPRGSDNGILPVVTKTGIQVISINLLLADEGDAVVWRGPLIAKAIKQFWEDVLWGKLDYLLVDLPPGTADAPLSVMQTLPVSGAVVIFTPQDLTAMIVKKALHMARMLEKKVLGVVENMSYLHVPEINKDIELFGKSTAAEMSRTAGAPLLARLPIDPSLAALCDAGKVEDYNSASFDELAKNLFAELDKLPAKE